MKRRSVLLGLSGCLVGGYLAWDHSGSGEGSMETGGEGRGCRNGVTERPENGTFEFVNILHFEEVELHIEVADGTNVDQIRVRSNDETIHTEDVSAGKQVITFAAGGETTFDLVVLNSEGSVMDRAAFYSRCSARPDDSIDTTAS